MIYIIRFAWKNVFRYARRTWITSMAMAVGVMLFVWMDAFMKGVNAESIRNYVNYESAHANVIVPRFQELLEETGILDLEYSFVGKERIIKEIRRKGYEATARIRYSARVINATAGIERIVMVTGIDPSTDSQVFKLREGLNPGGKWLTPGSREAMIGSDF